MTELFYFFGKLSL